MNRCVAILAALVMVIDTGYPLGISISGRVSFSLQAAPPAVMANVPHKLLTCDANEQSRMASIPNYQGSIYCYQTPYDDIFAKLVITNEQFQNPSIPWRIHSGITSLFDCGEAADNAGSLTFYFNGQTCKSTSYLFANENLCDDGSYTTVYTLGAPREGSCFIEEMGIYLVDGEQFTYPCTTSGITGIIQCSSGTTIPLPSSDGRTYVPYKDGCVFLSTHEYTAYEDCNNGVNCSPETTDDIEFLIGFSSALYASPAVGVYVDVTYNNGAWEWGGVSVPAECWDQSEPTSDDGFGVVVSTKLQSAGDSGSEYQLCCFMN